MNNIARVRLTRHYSPVKPPTAAMGRDLFCADENDLVCNEEIGKQQFANKPVRPCKQIGHEEVGGPGAAQIKRYLMSRGVRFE
jgi:hypothetical protein